MAAMKPAALLVAAFLSVAQAGPTRIVVNGVELHYIDVPVDELWDRVHARNAEPPWDGYPITRSHLDEWAALFEAPDAGELALFDAPPRSN